MKKWSWEVSSHSHPIGEVRFLESYEIASVILIIIQMRRASSTKPLVLGAREPESPEAGSEKKELNKRSKRLKNVEVKKWLNQRCGNKARIKYLKSSLAIQKEKEIENLFILYDEDRSGTLEINEMRDMFYAHGITLSRSQLQTVF